MEVYVVHAWIHGDIAKKLGNSIASDEMGKTTANCFNFGKFWHLLAGFTFLRAIFHILPIAGPLLAPFEFEVAALADFRCEAILDLCLHGDRLARCCALAH
jgi:hypothetical protein